MKTAEEMVAYGRRGKPEAGFPPRPQALEIAVRFPHSLSRDGRWESGKPTAGFPLSHRSTIYMDGNLKSKTRRPEARSYAPHFRLILRLENAALSINFVVYVNGDHEDEMTRRERQNRQTLQVQ